MATKAWLPVGFKQTDFSHLGEGSYCFCKHCRARLFPKRTNAEKAQAKAALAAEKAQALLAAEQAELGIIDDFSAEGVDELEAVKTTDIHVEELEIESVELVDLEEGSVNLGEEGSCGMAED